MNTQLISNQSINSLSINELKDLLQINSFTRFILNDKYNTDIQNIFYDILKNAIYYNDLQIDNITDYYNNNQINYRFLEAIDDFKELFEYSIDMKSLEDTRADFFQDYMTGNRDLNSHIACFYEMKNGLDYFLHLICKIPDNHKYIQPFTDEITEIHTELGHLITDINDYYDMKDAIKKLEFAQFYKECHTVRGLRKEMGCVYDNGRIKNIDNSIIMLEEKCNMVKQYVSFNILTSD
tara:strand:+ start:1650 stop:2360 length:711 start_codon:yes stop_codon:yes gene_type:complete